MAGGAPLESRPRRGVSVLVLAMTLMAGVAIFAVHHFYATQAGVRVRGRRARDLALEKKLPLRRSAEAEEKPQQQQQQQQQEHHAADEQPTLKGFVSPVRLDPPALPETPPYIALGERFNSTSGVMFRASVEGEGHKVMKWRTISTQSPRAYYVENFWEDAEADWLQEVAREKLEESQVVGVKRRQTHRTSKGMFVTDHNSRNPIILKARERVSHLSGMPTPNIEATQVLRYNPGERYVAHPDFFSTAHKEHLALGGQRVATLLSWIANTDEGGLTAFPYSRNEHGEPYKVKPSKGDAIIFWNCLRDQDPNSPYCTGDQASFHEAEPPKPGSTKWVGVFWIRQRRFG